MSAPRNFDVSVQSPCSESWDAMPGTASARHCGLCNKTVHDLAHMQREAIELLAMQASAGEAVCGRITRGSDGELRAAMPVTGGRSYAGPVLLSAALAAGLPAAAQMPKLGSNADLVAAGKSSKATDDAILTGTLLKPDGTPVSSGLINLSGWWFVADDRGRFELHARPGTYDVVVQTAVNEAAHIGVVELHAGQQSFGYLKTQTGRGDLVANDITVTMGAMVSTLSGWSWRGRLRHPVLYVRAVVRKMR